MAAYDITDRLKQDVSNVTESTNSFENEKKSIKNSRKNPFTSLLTLYKNETHILKKRSPHGEMLFISRSNRAPRFELAGVIISDPGTGDRWVAKLPNDEDVTYYTRFKDVFYGKKGVYLSHASPRDFRFEYVKKQPNARFVSKFSCRTMISKLQYFLVLFYKHHLLLHFEWDFFNNLSCFEKRLVATTGIFFAFLIAALYQGFTYHAFYFFNRFDYDSRVIQTLLAKMPKHTQSIIITLSFALMFFLLLCLKIFSGKWIRQTEDKLSYWQGVSIAGTGLKLIKYAVLELYHFGCLRCFPVSRKGDVESEFDYESDEESTVQQHEIVRPSFLTTEPSNPSSPGVS